MRSDPILALGKRQELADDPLQTKQHADGRADSGDQQGAGDQDLSWRHTSLLTKL